MSNQNQNDNGIIKEKLKKVAELKEIGIEPYGRKYEKVNNIAEINQYDETCDKVFKTAGRISAVRRRGKNGCGKSTLIKILAKNLNYNSGSIKLEGKELNSYSLKELANILAIVYQKNETPREITVYDMVSFARLPYQNIFFYKPSASDIEKIEFALEKTNLKTYRDKRVDELSGGQLQRVYIAMALAQSTDIIILDEPTTFLDIKYQKSIMQLVRELNKSLGITIIMVLHDINQALAYSDNIIALLDGKVIKNDQAANFFDENLLNRLYDADIKIEDGKVISW